MNILELKNKLDTALIYNELINLIMKNKFVVINLQKDMISDFILSKIHYDIKICIYDKCNNFSDFWQYLKLQLSDLFCDVFENDILNFNKYIVQYLAKQLIDYSLKNKTITIIFENTDYIENELFNIFINELTTSQNIKVIMLGHINECLRPTLYISDKDIAFSLQNIKTLIKVFGCKVENTDDLAIKLKKYFGCWDFGIIYAINMIYSSNKDDIFDIYKNPIYKSYLTKVIKSINCPDLFSFLKKIYVLPDIDEKSCNDLLSIKWSKQYIDDLYKKGIILKDDKYYIPEIIKQGLCYFNLDYDKLENNNAYLNIIGDFKLTYLGKEVKWRTNKTKELFAYLFFNSNSKKENIIEDLWPHIEYDKAEHLFYTTMSYLKKNLTEIGLKNIIKKNNKKYFICDNCFNSDYKNLLELKKNLDEQNYNELVKYNIGNANEILGDNSWSWSYHIIADIERIYLNYYRIIADLEINKNNIENAIIYLKNMLRIDPYSEYAVIMLMHCYKELKQFNNINILYNRTKMLYSNELSVDISKEIQKAYKNSFK